MKKELKSGITQMNKRYKFLKLKNNKLKSSSGNEIWSVGKWEKFDGELKMCESGFHCSGDKYDAFNAVAKKRIQFCRH